MKFANLNKKIDKEAKVYSKPKRSKKKVAIYIGIFLLIIVLGIYMPLRGIYTSARAMRDNGKALSQALQNENLDQIKTSLTEVKKANSNLKISLNFLIWLRVIPFLGSFYADVSKFVTATGHELNAAEKVIGIIEPHKIELGFDGNPTPGADRIAQMVKVLDKTLPNIDKIEPDLRKAKDTVEGIDVLKYPEQFRQYRVRSLVESAKNGIIGAHYAVTEAKDALMVAPSALGEPSEKNYLIIFQNDKEIRATGGFMTAYAFMTLNKGRVSSSISDDIYRLDEKLLSVCRSKVCSLTPPDPIVKYLPETTGKPRTVWAMRDSNISPDVPTSMREFERMYQLLGEGLPFDGIILIDTHVVEELIKITGPIEVFGTRYSADYDDRCNCPNVIYELENYAQIIEKGEEDRKAILGTLMQQILARSLGASTEKFPEFINAGVKLANSKHIMFYMHDQKTQDALAKLNWIGEIKGNPSTGSGQRVNYLHINDSNFAGGKSNMYVKQEVELDINTKGKPSAKVTINYSNPQKYDRWLNGINRDYVRVYVPGGSKLTSSRGSEVKVTTIESELGKTVFEAFIQVRPQNSTKLSFEYELPGEIKGEAPLLIQKQPGKGPFKYTIKVNGVIKESFELDMDKELKF